MPVYLLAPLVVLGIIAVVLLVRALFRNTPQSLGSRGDVASIVQSEFADIQLGEKVWIGSDRRSAVFEIVDQDAKVGYLAGMGARWVVRIYSASEIKTVNRPAPQQVQMMTSEFALPSIHLHFDDVTIADRVEQLVRRL